MGALFIGATILRYITQIIKVKRNLINSNNNENGEDVTRIAVAYMEETEIEILKLAQAKWYSEKLVL